MALFGPSDEGGEIECDAAGGIKTFARCLGDILLALPMLPKLPMLPMVPVI